MCTQPIRPTWPGMRAWSDSSSNEAQDWTRKIQSGKVPQPIGQDTKGEQRLRHSCVPNRRTARRESKSHLMAGSYLREHLADLQGFMEGAVNTGEAAANQL